MPEYIEREAAIELLSQPITMSLCLSVDECHHKIAQRRIDLDLIKSIPAADVRPVVFCKDCIHSDTFAPDCTETTFPLKCLFIRYGGVYPDWFCEHGEKREES